MRKPTICICENKDADQLRGTAKLISAFVFATWIVQSLYFLNPKFQASSHLEWLYSLVCVRPGQNPHFWFSHVGAHIHEHLRTHEAFTEYWVHKRFFFHNYQQFSIKSYIVAINQNRVGEAIFYRSPQHMILWRTFHFYYRFNTNPRFPPFLVYVSNVSTEMFPWWRRRSAVDSLHG